MANPITLAIDTTAVAAIVDELSLLAAQCPPELVDAFGNRVIDLFEQGRAFDKNVLTTTSASELKIGMVPSDDLRTLLTAARAGDFNG